MYHFFARVKIWLLRKDDNNNNNDSLNSFNFGRLKNGKPGQPHLFGKVGRFVWKNQGQVINLATNFFRSRTFLP